uniref:Uncharacterized protein n=1 Tax=Globisporangium ultimum (strain ATCC 200006 / CBS 805.95 / DAOM BR144) TaxID=431595 RepID=K3X4J4_GLOUD
MDASDFGLCVIGTTHKTYLTHSFTSLEQSLISEFKAGTPNDFDINYRELLSCLIGTPHATQVELMSGFALYGFQFEFGCPIRGLTIRIQLHSIRHFSAASSRVRMLVKGISCLDAPRQYKAPISVQLLEACFNSLSMLLSLDQALWGSCASRFFLLRRSEISAVSGSRFKWFALKGGDLIVTDAQGSSTSDPMKAIVVHVKLRGSKPTKSRQYVWHHSSRCVQGRIRSPTVYFFSQAIYRDPVRCICN